MRPWLPVWRAKAAEPAPPQSWTWRPDPWQVPLERQRIDQVDRQTSLTSSVTLHHDGIAGEVALEQVIHGDDLARFALRLSVGAFKGSFLGLSIDLPQDGYTGLDRTQIAQVDLEIETQAVIYARLNIRHGPDALVELRHMPGGSVHRIAEVDLAYTDLPQAPVNAAWVDVLIEKPAQTEMILRDLVLSRRRRAEV